MKHRTITAAVILSVMALAPLAGPGRAGGKLQPPDDLPRSHETGFKAFTGKCAQCHEPERAYNRKYADPKAIKALVVRMARKPGAAISKDDQKRIIAYLTWYHGRNQGAKD